MSYKKNNTTEIESKAKNIYASAMALLSDIEEESKNFQPIVNKDCASVKEKIESKIIQFFRKAKETHVLNELIADYAHKGHSMLDESNLEDLEIIAENYCLIKICIEGWTQNIESTNTAINRIVAVLDFLENSKNENNCHYKRYEQMKKYLWESELPFKEGKTYGRLSLKFPLNEDKTGTLKLKDENKINIFIDSEGLYLKSVDEGLDSEFVNSVRSKFIDAEKDGSKTREKVWSCLCIKEKDCIEKIAKFVIQRNKAIFIMLFFHLRGSVRQPYVRESDRITSSEVFRYLQYKSQVMINSAADDQRTRLAHSLEVAGVAKTIAKQLECNWELAVAMSLGHDIGHVPFGHSGEEALDSCLHKSWAGRFLHSMQSVKVVGKLAHHASIHERFGIAGMCLSRPVMEGILKHDSDNLFHDICLPSWRLQYDDWQEVLIRDNAVNVKNRTGKEICTREPEWEGKGLALGGLESQITYWADKIAYTGHDWEELAKSGIIEQKTREIEHILKRMHQLRHMGHARIGAKHKIDEVNSEVDLIRLIRYHVDNIWKTLSVRDYGDIDKLITNKLVNFENNPQYSEITKLVNEALGILEDNSETTKCIYKAFEPSKAIIKSVEKIKDNENDESDEVCAPIKIEEIEHKFKGCGETTFSPLARFVYALSICIEKITNSKKFEFKIFTENDYKLILYFFRIAHDMIYITKTYPRADKKSDDVLWVICRYLIGIDNRCVVQALQSDLLIASRDKITTAALNKDIKNEEDVLKLGRDAFTKPYNKPLTVKLPNGENSKKITTLEKARETTRDFGYIEDNKYKEEIKKLKKWFKETLQSEMFICLSDTTIPAFNRVTGFIMEYYIGDAHLRIMKHKANLIVGKLYEFFTKKEDMLPPAQQKGIDSYMRKLINSEDSEANEEFNTRLLVIKYILERTNIDTKYTQICKKIEKKSNLSIEKATAKELIDLGISVGGLPEDVIPKKIINALLEKQCDIDKLVKNKSSEMREEYEKLCKYLAKNRVIADYIATMTDRYAESKYNEIVSSDTSWTKSSVKIFT